MEEGVAPGEAQEMPNEGAAIRRAEFKVRNDRIVNGEAAAPGFVTPGGNESRSLFSALQNEKLLLSIGDTHRR
jgi:hypothetical protein